MKCFGDGGGMRRAMVVAKEKAVVVIEVEVWEARGHNDRHFGHLIYTPSHRSRHVLSCPVTG